MQELSSEFGDSCLSWFLENLATDRQWLSGLAIVICLRCSFNVHVLPENIAWYACTLTLCGRVILSTSERSHHQICLGGRKAVYIIWGKAVYIKC
jgi:hypothetical protein